MDKIETRKNKLANFGLGLGIVSVFLSDIGIIPLLTIIISSIALSKVKEHNGNGKTKAIIGLILGIIYMISNAYQHGHI